MARYCTVVDLVGMSEDERTQFVALLERNGWLVEDIPLTRGPEPALVLSSTFADDGEALAAWATVCEAAPGIRPARSAHLQQADIQLAERHAMKLMGTSGIVKTLLGGGNPRTSVESA